MKDKNGVEFAEGQRVKALRQITENGKVPGDPQAKFPKGNYIHAEAGELGTIRLVDAGNDDHPTVYFDRTGTGTVVGHTEIEVVG